MHGYRYVSSRYVGRRMVSGESSLLKVNRGVSHEGVLSPALLNSAIIGIKKFAPQSLEITLFADDICIWRSGCNNGLLSRRLYWASDSIESFHVGESSEIALSKWGTIALMKPDFKRYGLNVGEGKFHASRLTRCFG